MKYSSQEIKNLISFNFFGYYMSEKNKNMKIEVLFYFIDNSNSIEELISKLEARNNNEKIVEYRQEKITVGNVIQGLKKINQKGQYQIDSKGSDDLRQLKSTLRHFGKKDLNNDKSIRQKILDKMYNDWDLIELSDEGTLFFQNKIQP